MTREMDSRFHGNDEISLSFIQHLWDSLESPDGTYMTLSLYPYLSFMRHVVEKRNNRLSVLWRRCRLFYRLNVAGGFADDLVHLAAVNDFFLQQRLSQYMKLV